MIDYRVSEFHTDQTGAELGERPKTWADHIRQEQGTFRITPKIASPHYRARSIVQAAGDYKLAAFGSSATAYRRDAHDANSDGDRAARLVMTTSGRIALSQNDDTVTVDRGDLGIVRMDYPMGLAYDNDASGFFLTVPDGVITRRLADAAPLLMDRRRPLVALLGTQIETMSRLRDTFTPWQFVKATESLFTLLENALDEGAAEHLGTLAQVAGDARKFVAAYSDDHRLTPHTLAEQLGWSQRYLSKALRETYDISPAALIRTTRAERARARLSDPRYRNIDEVLAASGFASPSAGREAFAARYQMSPSRMRELAAADLPH